jgi:hypothetical protein
MISIQMLYHCATAAGLKKLKNSIFDEFQTRSLIVVASAMQQLQRNAMLVWVTQQWRHDYRSNTICSYCQH